jgi:hypothetical protein
MQTLGNARAHFWKVVKMAKTCDVDLSTALDEGRIDIDGYAGMITGCQGCGQSGKCDRLLAKVAQLDQAPEYCVNRDAFAQLREA